MIYELSAPTAWAVPPTSYSFSSLRVIQECPRRWFLLNSRWGDFPRFPQRPAPSAIEGQIVHEVLDRLAKALGALGRPQIGTPAFTFALDRVGFWRFFSDQIADWNVRLAKHPRAVPNFVIRTTPGALANKAVRLLREQEQACQGRIWCRLRDRIYLSRCCVRLCRPRGERDSH